jgi:hypothetical protein
MYTFEQSFVEASVQKSSASQSLAPHAHGTAFRDDPSVTAQTPIALSEHREPSA